MSVLFLLILGLFVGLISAFFGVGGGVIIVPTLYLVYPHFPAQLIIGTSLFIILLTSSLNSFHYYRKGVSWPLNWIISLGVFCSLGAWLGSEVAYLMNRRQLQMLFTAFLTLVLIRLLWKNIDGPQDESSQTQKNLISLPKLSLTALSGGMISSLTGLGGGAVFIPLLMTVVKVPLQLVAATSNLGMVFTSLVGTLIFSLGPGEPLDVSTSLPGLHGYVHYSVAFIVFSGAFLSSRLGVRLNQRVSHQKRRYAFIVLLTLIIAQKLYTFVR